MLVQTYHRQPILIDSKILSGASLSAERRVGLISPKPGGKITNASAELETVYGTVKSAWTLENGLLKLDVTIPANTKAKVVLPEATKEIGSGNYHFESKI